MTTITPFLWFDGRLDDAVSSYRTIFADFELLESSRYPEEIPGMGGQLMSATVGLAGTRIILFNGGRIEQQGTPAEIYAQPGSAA